MKKLLVTIAVTACLFLVFDRTLGSALGYLYSLSNATDEYKVSYSNETTRDSVLFMGSSRCLHHYVPSVFEEQLHTTCFNAADWGIKNIYYHYGLLGNILSRYTPRTIVFEIHPCDWLDTPFSGTERATSLAPYCGMSEACDDMLRLSGKYWPYRLSMVYRYTGSLPSLIAGKLGVMDRSLKGWKPLDGVIDTAPDNTTAEEYPFPVDSQRVALLHQFVRLCLDKDITLVLIESPMYVCSDSDVFKFPRELANHYRIPFIDHYRDTAFVHHQEFFHDFGHLNREGALRYSRVVAKELGALLRSAR